MRGLIIGALVWQIVASVAQASVINDPDVATPFFNAIPDICFRTARGHPPTAENAATMLLEPTTAIPKSATARFPSVPNWFRLQSQPYHVFVGVGDKANACHIVLANTPLTQQVQTQVALLLKIGGFQVLREAPPTAEVNDTLLVREAPDGYMLVHIEGPRTVVRGGEGAQAAVNVNIMSKEMFESIAIPVPRKR